MCPQDLERAAGPGPSACCLFHPGGAGRLEVTVLRLEAVLGLCSLPAVISHVGVLMGWALEEEGDACLAEAVPGTPHT